MPVVATILELQLQHFTAAKCAFVATSLFLQPWKRKTLCSDKSFTFLQRQIVAGAKEQAWGFDATDRSCRLKSCHEFCRYKRKKERQFWRCKVIFIAATLTPVFAEVELSLLVARLELPQHCAAAAIALWQWSPVTVISLLNCVLDNHM